jgi:hypothetical protein
VGFLGRCPPSGSGVPRLGGAEPRSAGCACGPLQPPCGQGEVTCPRDVALGPGAEDAYQAVKPGAPRPPEGADDPSQVAGRPVGAPRPVPEAVERGEPPPYAGVGGRGQA